MRQLILKEVRGLKPWVGLAVLLSLFGLVLTLGTEFPDEQTFDPSKFLGEEVEAAIITMLLITVLTGAGLLVNEEENGTLLFLDGLPLSRTRIFLAKIAAAIIVLGAILLFEITQIAGLGLLSQDSASGPFPWRFLAVETALLYAMMISSLGVVLLLSFLRTWLALALGLLVVGHLMLQMESTPVAALFDPVQLVRPGVDGARIEVPWKHLGTQFGVGLVCAALAWVGFVRLGGRRSRSATGIVGVLRRLTGFALRAAIPVVWIAALIIVGKDLEDDDNNHRPGREIAFARETTAHYEFLFREDQRPHAEPLIQGADKVFETVADFLGIPSARGRVVVDLAGPLVHHAAGQAHWKKVRMSLNPAEDLESLKAVLGHETTHVCIDLASDSVATGRLDWARWFHEGLSTYVEMRFFGQDAQQEELDRVSAHALDRGTIRFGEFVVDAEFARHRDPNLVYPLGQLWCKALVNTYGDGAPGRVCRAMTRAGVRAASDADGFWRTALQQSGYDLERVNAAFNSELRHLEEKHAEWLESYPPISGHVTIEGAEIVLRPQYEISRAASNATLVARLTDRRPEELIESEFFLPENDGCIRVARNRFPGATIRFQWGWTPERKDGAGRFSLFEKWEEAVVR